MSIVTIFANKLYAVHYEGADTNELMRLLDLWQDTQYVFDFVTEHEGDLRNFETVDSVVQEIQKSADEIEDILLEENVANLDEWFKPLDNLQYHEGILAKQKGRETYLRIYALKIEPNCYVVTGGAIKLTQKMEDREHTSEELRKLNISRQYLQNNGVFDIDSFTEYLEE